VVEVELWAELRCEHFVGGKSIKELARATGLSRNTVRRALRSERVPSYARAPRESVLEPFKDEIHRLLREDPKLPGVRVRDLLEPLGCDAGKTVIDDYLREVRPLSRRRRGRFSGRSIGRARSASSMSGARARRCRSGMARRVAAGSLSRAWATRAPARAC
jgi:transcriptional regulator with XRE-family HTH domain